MRIVITGGAGFIGSNLVRHMIHNGHHVLVLDKLTYAGNLQSLQDVQKSNLFQFAKVDIADSQAVKTAIEDYQPQAVMHLAAESHVDRSIDGPSEFIQTNIVGTFNLLQASFGYWQRLSSPQKKQFRFLQVSTDEVYGSLGASGYFTEETRYDPHSPYSASKAAADHLSRAWADTYKLPVLVTNCSNNYGPFQFPEKLVPVVLLKGLRGEPIPIYGQGENVRDWLHVADHCRALELVLEKGKVGRTYNIGGGNELRNVDLVRLLCRLLDELQPRSDGKSYSEQITFVADRPGHDMRYAIDSTRIRDELGWQPRYDTESGFRRTVQWFLENEEWWRNILSGDYQLERLGSQTSPLNV